ncbi:MAG TPA: hypothetical protein ENN60_01340 [archaeon]|nr:hypothetical protein [archaeon]
MGLMVALLVMVSAGALEFYHPTEVLMLPNSTRELVLTVGNPGPPTNVTLGCTSELTVVCPPTVELPHNGTQEVLVRIRGREAGLFPVYLQAGGVKDTLLIRVSESPRTLEGLLVGYYQVLTRTEGRTGRTRASALAEGVIHNAFMLYEEGKYEEVAGEIENIRLYLDRASQEPTIFPSGDEETGTGVVALGFTLGPVILLIALGGLMIQQKFRIHNQKHIDFTRDLKRVKSEAVIVENLKGVGE